MIRKLYSLSASNQTVPYHNYIRRRNNVKGSVHAHGGLKSSFIDVRNDALLKKAAEYAKQSINHQGVPGSAGFGRQARNKAATRTSWEHIATLEEEIDQFLGRMRKEYIDQVAEGLEFGVANFLNSNYVIRRKQRDSKDVREEDLISILTTSLNKYAKANAGKK